MQLCYNAWHPLEILREQRVRTSVLDKRDRGLSFSGDLGMWGHGPFKFIFEPDRPWYSQFQKVCYGGSGPVHQLSKNPCFVKEQEWWSPSDVHYFDLMDIDRVVFMTDSPGARIHPIICRRRWSQVLQEFHSRVVLVQDHDHYPPLDPPEEEVQPWPRFTPLQKKYEKESK